MAIDDHIDIVELPPHPFFDPCSGPPAVNEAEAVRTQLKDGLHREALLASSGGSILPETARKSFRARKSITSDETTSPAWTITSTPAKCSSKIRSKAVVT